jgi:hypothetical protein
MVLRIEQPAKNAVLAGLQILVRWNAANASMLAQKLTKTASASASQDIGSLVRPLVNLVPPDFSRPRRQLQAALLVLTPK